MNYTLNLGASAGFGRFVLRGLALFCLGVVSVVGLRAQQQNDPMQLVTTEGSSLALRCRC